MPERLGSPRSARWVPAPGSGSPNRPTSRRSTGADRGSRPTTIADTCRSNSGVLGQLFRSADDQVSAPNAFQTRAGRPPERMPNVTNRPRTTGFATDGIQLGPVCDKSPPPRPDLSRLTPPIGPPSSIYERRVAIRSLLPSASSMSHSRPASPSSSTGTRTRPIPRRCPSHRDGATCWGERRPCARTDIAERGRVLPTRTRGSLA